MIENNFTPQRFVTSKRLIVGLLVTIFLIFVYGVYQILKPFSGPQFGEVVEVTIEDGMGQAEIAAELKGQGVIDSSFFFRVYVTLTGSAKELKAGKYSIGKGEGIRQATDLLTAAQVQSPTVRITLLEGWRSDQVVDYLAEQGLDMDIQDFADLIEAGKPPQGLDQRLFKDFPKKGSLEGYLYPDTYEIYRDISPEQLLVLLVGTLDSKMTDDLWFKVAQSDLNFYEIITLASIVEREVFDSADRRIVAGIFLERLADSYPLQSDATVNYITGKKTTRPSHDDLEVESLYNTYQNKGLPPTPISNPSLDAIEAVLSPKQSDYYFFLTTLDNETIFSRNFEEHLSNKRKYYPE